MADFDPSDPDDHLICFCHKVPKSQIRKAIREGAKTVEEIQAETCASTGCGTCEFEVAELLEAEMGKTDPKSNVG